jgi:hypothetical protein
MALVTTSATLRVFRDGKGLELGRGTFELPDHGALAPTWIEPDGMAQLTLGENIPSPYEPAATEAAP